MPTAHGVVQGYTGVATVDDKHQVVVYAEAFGENQEKCLLQPAVEGVRENFSKSNICKDAFKKAVLVADTGYHSDKNIEMLIEKGVDAIIADTMFRKRDPRFSEADRFRMQPRVCRIGGGNRAIFPSISNREPHFSSIQTIVRVFHTFM